MGNPLLRALIVGLILAGGGIGLFFLLYFVALANAEPAFRLLVSLIVPPAAMFILVLAYYILTQDEKDAS